MTSLPVWSSVVCANSVFAWPDLRDHLVHRSGECVLFCDELVDGLFARGNLGERRPGGEEGLGGFGFECFLIGLAEPVVLCVERVEELTPGGVLNLLLLDGVDSRVGRGPCFVFAVGVPERGKGGGRGVHLSLSLPGVDGVGAAGEVVIGNPLEWFGGETLGAPLDSGRNHHGFAVRAEVWGPFRCCSAGGPCPCRRGLVLGGCKLW